MCNFLWHISLTLEKDDKWGKVELLVPMQRKISPVKIFTYFTRRKSKNAFISCESLNLDKPNYKYFLLE